MGGLQLWRVQVVLNLSKFPRTKLILRLSCHAHLRTERHSSTNEKYNFLISPTVAP
uniref:Uncharacterized protein n=1 Tax=Anguilla anguilla TaxID=7936 RepID=A0A0E9PVD8_ANGAN